VRREPPCTSVVLAAYGVRAAATAREIVETLREKQRGKERGERRGSRQARPRRGAGAAVSRVKSIGVTWSGAGAPGAGRPPGSPPRHNEGKRDEGGRGMPWLPAATKDAGSRESARGSAYAN